MRIVIFCHSLVSDWNHGNAHFLRGIVAELKSRRHDVTVYEPADGWSRQELLADAGWSAVEQFHRAFPTLSSISFALDGLCLDEAIDDADLVIVHEWNSHDLVERIGRHKGQGGRYTLLFHDTHHRSVTAVESMTAYHLEHYDGVLAFGEVIRERYLALGWSRRAWTWHEAADTRTFTPRPAPPHQDDLVWIGNWGDEERSGELRAYLIDPVRDLTMTASIYGVRYPVDALQELADAHIRYGGWLPNYEAPLTYARHKMTVHVPRRPYVEALPGIPTIRVFEALACGVPLVSAAWHDAEHLFTPGDDFLVADTPAAMRTHLRTLMHDEARRQSLAACGLETIRRRHTCAHRVDELIGIVQELRSGASEETLTA